jgi:hypothetical protein
MVSKTRGGLSRRKITWLWIIGFTAVIIALLYWEQTALLYVLATLGVSGLLIIVAMSDLAHARKSAATLTEIDDSAALGSGITEASSGQAQNWGARSSKKR